MKPLASSKPIKIVLLLCLSLVGISQSNSQDSSKQLDVTEALFKCLTEMTKSSNGDYFVDNMLGDLAATVAVANSETGGEFPTGSVVSLIPTEVMIKHEAGWNAETDDWEFFELNVSEAGSEIKVRGTTEVVNQFGGNCFGCHTLAREEWDLICGTGHGCAPLPIDRETIANIQNGDPRCIKED
ncbi:MAG: hypothetical protein DHS20C12_21710 [Pseudohongiella sp.]|nr:MAG: hypothetical protein DHS20C12_21710 [Pseudohongiella sp.]